MTTLPPSLVRYEHTLEQAIRENNARTQSRRLRRFAHPPRRRLGLLLCAVAAIALPAGAFAEQIGQILGFSNGGTPVPESQLPDWQLSALQATGFSTRGVRVLGVRAGTTFYASRQADGGYCYGVGFAATPHIDALACGSHLGTFPSRTDPVADLSAFGTASDGTIRVTRLVGFASDAIAEVRLLDSGGNPIYRAPVVHNIYAADGLPNTPAAVIAGVDSQGRIAYQKQLATPAAPKPSTPPSPSEAVR